MNDDWCLITDIDGTLLGESTSTQRLRHAVLEARAELARRGGRLHWVVATGRNRASTREVLEEEGFRADDFQALITSVGAELHLPGEDAANAAYSLHLSRSGFTRNAVLDALRELSFLALQADEEQFEHKVSYFMRDTLEHRRKLAEALSRLPFETELVLSHDEYLDVAPRHGAKGGAVAYLLDVWGLPATRAVAAGDSGNDVSMLEQAWNGVVVRNGWNQLAHLRARPNVHFAEGKHAAGVLEGLIALGFLPSGTQR